MNLICLYILLRLLECAVLFLNCLVCNVENCLPMTTHISSLFSSSSSLVTSFLLLILFAHFKVYTNFSNFSIFNVLTER